MDFHLQFEKGLAGTTPIEGRGKPLLHWCLLLLLAHSKIVAFVSTIFLKKRKKVKMSQCSIHIFIIHILKLKLLRKRKYYTMVGTFFYMNDVHFNQNRKFVES